jgi:hypothetical protein
MRVSTLIAAASIAVAPTTAFFILSHPILQVTRLDPIVTPGAVSSHVHTIIGGSNFQPELDYAKLQQSKCTTAPVTVDKSAYW